MEIDLKKILLALMLLSTPAMAAEPWEAQLSTSVQTGKDAVEISGNYGGGIDDFIKEYNALRQSEAKVRVTDVCLSACTLTLGLLDNVCAGPHAVFGFHSAWVNRGQGPEFSREGTRLVWNLYPESVKQVLRDRGWDGDGFLEHPDLIYVKGTDLMRACD